MKAPPISRRVRPFLVYLAWFGKGTAVLPTRIAGLEEWGNFLYDAGNQPDCIK